MLYSDGGALGCIRRFEMRYSDGGALGCIRRFEMFIVDWAFCLGEVLDCVLGGRLCGNGGNERLLGHGT